MNFENSKTKENLSRSFVAECTQGARYQFMAKDAKAKGYGFLSNTLKTLAKNEMAHARVFYDFILNKGKPARGSDCPDCGYENLQINAGYPFTNYCLPKSLGIESQTELKEREIYKEFEQTAKKEGFKEVAEAFNHVVQVENCHHLQLKELYEKMTSNKMYKMQQMNKWKCTNCGTEIEKKEAPKICPLCGYEQGYYMVPLQDE